MGHKHSMRSSSAPPGPDTERKLLLYGVWPDDVHDGSAGLYEMISFDGVNECKCKHWNRLKQKTDEMDGGTLPCVCN